MELHCLMILQLYMVAVRLEKVVVLSTLNASGDCYLAVLLDSSYPFPFGQKSFPILFFARYFVAQIILN